MKIAVIGFGNIGKTFTNGVLNKKIFSAEEIFACDMSAEARSYAEKTFGIKTYENIDDAAEKADIVLWAVKGHIFSLLAEAADKSLLCKKEHISFMAGMSIAQIEGALNSKGNVVRGMPTLAMKNNNAVIGYTHANDVFLIKIFESLGYAFEVKEEDLEKLTAYSSCGLGFAAYMLDAYKQAGMNMGFDEETCEHITAQTFANAVEIGNYADTVKAVSTKGGATELGVEYMNEQKLFDIVRDTVRIAYEKFAK